MKVRYQFTGDGETRTFETPEPPTPGSDTTCGRCGAAPVTHAEFRTGGIFTPPPFGVWMFLCTACATPNITSLPET